MSGNYGDKFTADTGRSPSQSIWKKFEWDAIKRGDIPGYALFEDFLDFQAVVTAGSVVGNGRWSIYGDTGGTVAQLATEVGGVVRATIDATGDNEEAWLSFGSITSVLGKISDTAGDNQELAWEARVRFGQIVTQNLFVGMGQEGLVAADAIFSDADAIADKDMYGFRVLAADSDGMDAIHQKAGGSGEVVVLNAAQVLVADTWYKFGGYFNGTASYWYVDGVQKATSGGHTDGIGVLPGATGFPNGEELNFVFGGKSQGAVAMTADIDWFKFAQRATN